MTAARSTARPRQVNCSWSCWRPLATSCAFTAPLCARPGHDELHRRIAGSAADYGHKCGIDALRRFRCVHQIIAAHLVLLDQTANDAKPEKRQRHATHNAWRNLRDQIREATQPMRLGSSLQASYLHGNHAPGFAPFGDQFHGFPFRQSWNCSSMICWFAPRASVPQHLYAAHVPRLDGR